MQTQTLKEICTELKIKYLKSGDKIGAVIDQKTLDEMQKR